MPDDEASLIVDASFFFHKYYWDSSANDRPRLTVPIFLGISVFLEMLGLLHYNQVKTHNLRKQQVL